MDVYAKLTVRIIQEQENIIGPIALEQAQKVPGIILHWDKHEVELEGDEKDVIDQLVEQYEHLFGQASVEVCREAVKEILADMPSGERPKTLK